MRIPDLRHILKALALLACAVIWGTSSAQTHYNPNVAFGVRAGADMSQVMFNPSVPQQFKPGAVAGLTIRYIEENHFGLIAELDFVQRGWKEKFEGTPYNYSRTLNYLDIPVMTHIYFGRRGKFFFNAGPLISCLIGESTRSDFNPTEISSLPDFPLKGRRNEQLTMKAKNRMDYGICAGLGGEFNINPKNSLSLEARFYYGLGNIMSSRRADVFSASNSMTVSLALGYWFRIK